MSSCHQNNNNNNWGSFYLLILPSFVYRLHVHNSRDRKRALGLLMAPNRWTINSMFFFSFVSFLITNLFSILTQTTGNSNNEILRDDGVQQLRPQVDRRRIILPDKVGHQINIGGWSCYISFFNLFLNPTPTFSIARLRTGLTTLFELPSRLC